MQQIKNTNHRSTSSARKRSTRRPSVRNCAFKELCCTLEDEMEAMGETRQRAAKLPSLKGDTGCPRLARQSPRRRPRKSKPRAMSGTGPVPSAKLLKEIESCLPEEQKPKYERATQSMGPTACRWCDVLRLPLDRDHGLVLRLCGATDSCTASRVAAFSISPKPALRRANRKASAASATASPTLPCRRRSFPPPVPLTCAPIESRCSPGDRPCWNGACSARN